MQPLVLISPKLGLSAVTPLTSEGMRMLPRPSEPSVTGTVRVATAIALPLLEPPGVNLLSQGLTPQVPQASSPQCRCPSRTMPATSSRVQAAESVFATLPFSSGLSPASGRPATPTTSFNPTGMPVRAPASPRWRRASAAPAAASAVSS